MPIFYEIYHDRRLVVAGGSGRLTDSDVFAYQREVWGRADVTGYDELVDMTRVEEFVIPEHVDSRLRTLALESAGRDSPDRHAKFAIVVTDQIAYGLGRMYAVYREMQPGSNKEVQVFTSHTEALAWLGIESFDLGVGLPGMTEC